MLRDDKFQYYQPKKLHITEAEGKLNNKSVTNTFFLPSSVTYLNIHINMPINSLPSSITHLTFGQVRTSLGYF